MQVHGVPGLLCDFAEKTIAGGGVPLFEVTPFLPVNSKNSGQRIWSVCHELCVEQADRTQMQTFGGNT